MADMQLPRKVRAYAATTGDSEVWLQHRFHRWLNATQISLPMLRPKHVERFLAELLNRPLTPTSKAIYRRKFLHYLDWLHLKGLIHFNPDWFRPKSRPQNVTLPDTALRFLNNWKGAGYRAKYPLPAFHSWLDKKRLSLSKLTPKHIDRFLVDFSKRPATQESKNESRRRLLRYLDWLYDEGNIPFDPRCLRPEHHLNALLDDNARRFLQHLRTTLKEGTVSGYRSTLRAFHRWLESNKLALSDITRIHMTQWFVELLDAGQSASCRATKVICIRIYFAWLNEEGLLNTNALHLVRTADIPKLPQYLPRPLPPKVDTILQQRLAAEDSVFHQGLLLMRKTGIRIGELIALPIECIHCDHNGNHFLKVPIGKLNNERLVPLDHDTLALVRKLQLTNPGPLKRWLIEDRRNRKAAYDQFRRALIEASNGLDTGGKITSHRLRHTYATSLLNAGMSLLSVMKLLGHRSYRMTLRYAAITQETVGKEYRQALKQLQSKYDNALPYPDRNPSQLNPLKMLSDINRWLMSNTPNRRKDKHVIELLIKRINKLKLDIANLQLA